MAYPITVTKPYISYTGTQIGFVHYFDAQKKITMKKRYTLKAEQFSDGQNNQRFFESFQTIRNEFLVALSKYVRWF